MNIHKDGKLAAIISHFFFLGPIIAYFINDEQKDAFGSFYIKQNVGISILFLLIGTLMGFIPYQSASFAFYLFIFIIWLYSFIGAISNKYNLIPFIGIYFQKWFRICFWRFI